MSNYYLAVDIGASSGRHMLFTIEDGKMQMDEIYRFENAMTNVGGKLLWDTKKLFNEIKNGMKECKRLGKIPCSMSIDTWGVDYVLLDEVGQVLGDTYGYRDHRTDGMSCRNGQDKTYEVQGEDQGRRQEVRKGQQGCVRSHT